MSEKQLEMLVSNNR